MSTEHAQIPGSPRSDLEIVKQLKAKLEGVPELTIDGLWREARPFLYDADTYGFDRLDPARQWAILMTERPMPSDRAARATWAKIIALPQWWAVRFVAMDAWTQIEILRGREGDLIAEEGARNDVPLNVDDYDHDDTAGMSDQEKIGWAEL